MCLTLAVGVASAEQHKKKGKNAEGAEGGGPQGGGQGGGGGGKKGKGIHRQQGGLNSHNTGALRNVSGNNTSGGGAGSGKAKFKEFNVKKQTDGAAQDGNANLHGKSKKMFKQGDGQGQGGLQAMKQGKKFQKKQFQLAKKAKANVPNVQFQAGMKIKNAHNWKGNKYVVFKNYKGEWHDHDWWHHHHNKIVFVFGGHYYWDNGYWFPAWGYAPDAFYAYEGPIYAGSPEMDPGQVVANVQAALQEQGFYVGEVDGVLGPLTRAALAQYQQAQGFEPTGAIDEPTLESLGMV